MIAVSLLLLFAAPRRAPCGGDCDGRGTIGANEVVTGVAIGLGVQPPEACPAFPPCDIAPVCVSDLIRAVGQALTMCEGPLELPQLAGSEPAGGAEGVSPASWIRLDFAVPFDPRLPARVALGCGGSSLPLT
ncbi:MAG: hypothetical protein SF182_27650, partial [Deltaproteobacteria bacterium]|nr:hypothetical protein [Deltaproteobacteria bacterium]